MRPLLVLEDTTRPPWRLFDALGVEWWATRWAWAGPLFWMALGWAVAWGEARAGAGAATAAVSGADALRTLPAGAGYGALLWLANAIHTLGHVASSRVAGTPMDAVVLTSTRDVTVYRGEKGRVPEGVRVVRSLGGPLANALAGGVAWAAALGPAGPATPWLRMAGVFNLCIAVWTLMPVPTMDGWIVWRWVLRRAPGAR